MMMLLPLLPSRIEVSAIETEGRESLSIIVPVASLRKIELLVTASKRRVSSSVDSCLLSVVVKNIDYLSGFSWVKDHFNGQFDGYIISIHHLGSFIDSNIN